MTINKSTKAAQANMITRAWRFLTEAHPSVKEIGERRRAQLLSALSLILTVSFTWAILSSPSALTTFYVLITITLLAYIFSRTQYYQLGAYFFSFGFTSLAYITLYTGTANSIDTSIASIVPISLIFASAILSQRGFLILAIAAVLATVSVPVYADPRYLEDPNLTFGRTIGITFSTAAILYGITAFRLSVERDRLKDIQAINSELADLTTHLEQRVNRRTAEIETDNKQTYRRAAQL